jgi:acyl-coenzyme A synthetase/AMP-(fatty) acid ligase
MDSNLTIYNREGLHIPDAQIKKEYRTIRQYLLDFHATESDNIAINQIKDYRYLLTMIACMEIGIPYVPMKYDYPEDRLAQIKDDAKFTLLFDDKKMEEVLAYHQIQRTELPLEDGNKNVYTIFTSGSTGRPKGVIIQRKALENFFLFMGKSFAHLTEKERMLQCTEFNFDLSVQDMALFLTRNVGVFFSNFGNNIFKFAFEIETHKISVINTVPNNLNMFLTDMVAERMDYQCLKHLNIGGARFSYGLYQKCLKYFSQEVEIHNFYGPTEATVYSHYKKITFDEKSDCLDNNVSIGKTVPNVTAVVVTEQGIAQANERGELYIGGIQTMKEYVNNPEQTARSIVDFQGERFYRSGDLAFITEAGDFYIVGRADDTIKYRGYRIDLLDIDSYITRLPYVQDSVTIAIPNETTENQTIGFMILKEKKTVKEIKQDLSKLLLEYQIPEKIILVDKFPINSSGKVCRKTLKADYLDSIQKA